MNYRYGFVLGMLGLLLAGCARIIIPIPVFIPVQQSSSQVVAPATTQTITQTTTLAPTQTTSPTASTEYLTQALHFAPTDTRALYFTNWALIKAYKGVSALNSQSPMDARMEFLLSLNQDQAAPVVYGSRAFLRFAEEWSWDSTDLLWEAMIDSEGSPVYILKLRDDFDLAPVLARFDERGFGQQMLDATTIYTHEIALAEDWFTIGELSIANTAVIAEAKILVLSSSLDGVQTVIERYQEKGSTLGDDQSVLATIAGLGEVAAAIVTPGSDTCRGLSFAAITQSLLQGEELSEEQIAELKTQLLGEAVFHTYSGFALGYRYEEEQPVGLVVMHYANAADAQADLDARRQAAEQGMSQATEQPFSEGVFTVDGAEVIGSELILRLRPYEDRPARLFQLFFYRDMAFAGCP